MDERVILDKLRTDGKLPNEPDYQGWRARHLASYQLKVPKELEPWHLPDGRTVQVIAAPAGPKGGVIYVFEDITDQLNLKSQHKAVLDVQRSTLNALTEAVAVFGTNGRLTLCNPRLSSLWKVPTNLLNSNPHIDQISEAVAKAMPDDGATIWRDLKRSIIDLNPTRSDREDRITRADGKLIDYKITRLPDGQTMMTFLDVTESANYQRVLKERNEALITADRLKDAFVQNVSYELRSPLTNIIGFADLLASGTAGALNDKQRSYTDYIRSSSVTLGVLIDNILDLQTVDAGIAELRPEVQDVATLVEKARAGVMATDGGQSINLTVEIEPNLPPFIADGTRIVQVLYNLLSNAARYSEPGGQIKLTVSGRANRIQFVVEDDGAPMSEEMRAAMLGNDGTAASARQRGAGLGLAIVRAFVNLHGGTVTVDKREPRGSRVVVNLPVDASIQQAGAAE
ncbi:MAG: PAS domain-containing sensor histidine kinase [Myxococcales bacterium]|nr:MAG: PAS domain-containing sensor histidine kinase [Myxococcales bacterium]